MNDLTLDQVGAALRILGNYRCRRAQEVAGDGPPDGISGARILATGMRETRCRNINGGAVFDKPSGAWIDAPPEHQDAGWLQISRDWRRAALEQMPGVEEGTWGPIMPGVTAATPGYCPRFTDAELHTIEAMHESIAFADDRGVPTKVQVTFATAAHNAGDSGALAGYLEGNVDRYTVYGNYSAWVERHSKLVSTWLGLHPDWRP